METFELSGEFIPLNALMKLLDWVPSGGVANQLISDSQVVVNGDIELRKRRKLRVDDEVEFMGHRVKMIAAEAK